MNVYNKIKDLNFSIFRIIVLSMVFFLNSCASNVSFSKRYHNRGFNFSMRSNSELVKSVDKKNSRIDRNTNKVEVARENSDTKLFGPGAKNSIYKSPIIVENSDNIISESVKPNRSFTNYGTVKSPNLVSKEKMIEYQPLKNTLTVQKNSGPGKSLLIAIILCFFLGIFGIHRFYLGYTGVGVLMLLTFGCFGILWLIDFIRLIIGDLKPKNGNYNGDDFDVNSNGNNPNKLNIE
jgi:TM2 domain-containing membrane protein YozV